MTMRIGTNTWPGYEPLYLARDLMYIKKNEFRLVEHASATDVIKSFRNGLIDAAALTLDEVLILKQNGYDPRIVLVMDISHGGDVIIAQKGIEDFQKLKGKKIGVEKTALGAYMLARALEINGMKAGDIQSVNVELSEHESAFITKKVDAVVTFEPVRSRIIKTGGVQVFDSRKIPNEIVDVLIVKGSFLDQHPEAVQKLLKHWFRARDFLESKRVEAASFISQRHRLTPKEVLLSYSGLVLPGYRENQDMLLGMGKTGSLQTSALKLSKVMRSLGLLQEKIDMTSLFKGLEKIYPLEKKAVGQN
jgi:NitT/TauT family transport system substrate-binding protein